MYLSSWWINISLEYAIMYLLANLISVWNLYLHDLYNWNHIWDILKKNSYYNLWPPNFFYAHNKENWNIKYFEPWVKLTNSINIIICCLYKFLLLLWFYLRTYLALKSHLCLLYSNLHPGELYFKQEKMRGWSGVQQQDISNFERIRTVGKGQITCYDANFS